MSDTVIEPPRPNDRPLSALALTTPVAMGYIPLGTVFGFLFVQAGGEWWLAIFSSLLIYAGAAQYMMIPMIAAGLPIGTIALATLIVNLRHVFYGLSLLDRFPRHRLLRGYMIFALTDETYSVLTTIPASTPPRQMALIALLNQSWWVLGTTLGALVGAQAQIALAGLDFVLAALFAVLATEQWRSRKSAAPLWVALAAYALAYPLAVKHALVISIALSIVAGILGNPDWNSHAEQAMIESPYIVAAILAMAIVTFALRAVPFVAAQWLRKHPIVDQLGQFLPLAIMTLLTVHSAAGSAQEHTGAPWPEALAIALVAVLQWKSRNALLSILLGTGIYVAIRNSGWA